jgi:hypothetical protein
MAESKAEKQRKRFMAYAISAILILPADVSATDEIGDQLHL